MDFTGPLITIYDEIFADIVHDLAHLRELPDNEQILGRIGELAARSLDIYDSETGRMCAMHSLIGTLLGVQFDPRDFTSTAVSENVFVQKNSAIFLHMEFKSELGMGGKVCSIPSVCKLLPTHVCPVYGNPKSYLLSLHPPLYRRAICLIRWFCSHRQIYFSIIHQLHSSWRQPVRDVRNLRDCKDFWHLPKCAPKTSIRICPIL